MKGFKNVVFWAHLVCAIPAAVFIFLMLGTAVLLTYESQMVEAAASRNLVDVPAQSAPMPLDQLVAGHPPARGATLLVQADPRAPVTLSAGRGASALLNPYTGEAIPDQAAGLRTFFQAVERFHRYLTGARDGVGNQLNRASNLVFLFLGLSGIYIWLPSVYRWVQFRGRMFFNRRNVNSKARDYNWHHVFAFWAIVPILVMTVSGTVMSYGWANNLLFAAYGETAPQGRGGPPGAPQSGSRPEGGDAAAEPPASLDALLQSARSQFAQWKSISIPVDRSGTTVTVTAELQSEAQRAPRQQLVLRAADASVVRLNPVQGAGPGQATPGQAARGWMRFAHTGQQYGIVGQTIAGLSSLAAMFLVYTGLALAYRRLIKPLFNPR